MKLARRRRMLVPVYFNAPDGGLHNHVGAQAAAALRGGWDVFILCRPGEFATRMDRAGMRVLTTQYEDLGQSIDVALSAGPYHLVHAHPFRSRVVGLAVAEQLRIPAVLTQHSLVLDGIGEFHPKLTTIIAVSDVIRQAMLETGVPSSKATVIPNGVNLRRFRPALTNRRAARQVAIATRMDRDKSFILDLVEELWSDDSVRAGRLADIDWTVAGDGTEMSRVRDAANKLNATLGRDAVKLAGWLQPRDLARLLQRSSVVVAPGRSALEAMACGVPTIALGSRGYVGLLDGDRALAGIAENFGGGGARLSSYEPGSLRVDIEQALERDEAARRSQLSRAIARLHDQRLIDGHLRRHWELVGSLNPGGF